MKKSINMSKHYSKIFALILLFSSKCLFAQIGVTSFTTTNYNLPASTSIINRLGAGVKQGGTNLGTRYDSTGSNFTINFNSSTTADSVPVTSVTITGIGTGTLLNVSAVAKVKRVANTDVPSAGEHYPYWAAATGNIPGNNATTGTIDISAAEISTLENALVSNNINSGYDNVFQNTSANVHYANIERLDYVIPLGFTPSIAADLTKIGFTIYDRGGGDPFKIAGIKAVNASNDVTDYNVISTTPFAACLAVTTANFGANLLTANFNYVIFQKDPRFKNSETRPSTFGSQNIKGVFISLANLGFTAGQKVYGFSLIPDDIVTTTTVANLINFATYPTTTANANVLDLVNGLGVANFSQTVLASNILLQANYNSGSVFLSWTEVEKNIGLKFILQKSNIAYNSNNFIDFKNLDAVVTSYIDANPFDGTTFYRLKIIAANGSIDYSNIQLVNSKKNGTKFFPTVVNDFIYLKPDAIFTGKPINFNIYTADGKLINAVVESSSTLMSYNVAYLQKGKYFIVAKQGSATVASQYFIKE